MAALNTQLSADASYVKGVLKSSIRKGILDEGDETKHSFTKSLTKTMQKFTGSSTNATVAHGIHFLILRAFARQNKRLLKDTTRSEAPSSEITNTIDSETTTNAEDTNSGNGKVKGTTRKDFFSKLTDFFEQKEDAWGTDTAAGGYINEAIDAELLEHPTDTMPLIPRRSSANTHNTPSNMDVDRGNDSENEPPANASTSNHTRTSAHHSQFAGLFAPGGASA
ncbi:hypothetical protein BOTBODRAFT_346752 [Botryobasidium botryosum FD-172 SS1]|uniref:Uncharacterized protein n=1 Tax=Botryobasidium botryosum (strain FD-172 SS1) TaxID=930990 RepID=A0A067LRE2_BOTB1|nr:hypothetical protein BOTBODRAFT_346752 [Botryobasidium botryosum FD-172 SS1]